MNGSQPESRSHRVRAERDTAIPGGRRDAVTVRAWDPCGNASSATVIGHVLVRNGGRPVGCLASDCS